MIENSVAVWFLFAFWFLVSLAQALYGFVRWRSGGRSDVFSGLLSAIVCASFLMGPYTSASFRLASLAVGLALGLGVWVVARRGASADSGPSHSPNGNAADGDGRARTAQ